MEFHNFFGMNHPKDSFY